MAKTKRKPTKIQLTATQIAAEATVTPEMRQHSEYERVGFADRASSGAALDNHRMIKKTPVRALNKLKLEPYQIDAANEYDYYYLQSLGSCNHELKPFVNKSRAQALPRALEGGATVAAVKRHLMREGNAKGVFMSGLLRRIFETNRDDSLTVISAPANATKKQAQKAAEKNAPVVRELLDEIAVVLGIKTGG